MDAEETARSNVDTALQTVLDAEVSARTDADAALQGQVNAAQTAADAISHDWSIAWG